MRFPDIAAEVCGIAEELLEDALLTAKYLFELLSGVEFDMTSVIVEGTEEVSNV